MPGKSYFLILNKALPTKIDDPPVDAEGGLLMIQTWILADRYLMQELQNSVMLELLHHVNDYPPSKTFAVQALRFSPVDTPLRRLASESVVLLLYGRVPEESLRMPTSDLLALDGVVGLSASLLAAYEKLQEAGNSRFDRIFDSETWREFMVAGGPARHWIHRCDLCSDEE